jgi:tRNA(adenine34) deaminase
MQMVAIRDLCAKLGVAELKGCTLYCTLQPCGMCSLACVWAEISRILKTSQIALCPFNTCSSH